MQHRFNLWIRLLGFGLLLALLTQVAGVAGAAERDDDRIIDLPIVRVTGNRPSPQLGPRLGPEMPAGTRLITLQAGDQTIEVRAGEKWIEVDLSEQRVVAHEGDRPVREFLVSTGLPRTPTVTGVFRIWVRTPIQDMYDAVNGAYYLRDVQWVQYFYEDYGFHGTYWHNNYGQPMSSGCVNMTNEDAEWLFKWAMPEWDGEQGWLHADDQNNTLVVVHE